MAGKTGFWINIDPDVARVHKLDCWVVERYGPRRKKNGRWEKVATIEEAKHLVKKSGARRIAYGTCCLIDYAAKPP